MNRRTDSLGPIGRILGGETPALALLGTLVMGHMRPIIRGARPAGGHSIKSSGLKILRGLSGSPLPGITSLPG